MGVDDGQYDPSLEEGLLEVARNKRMLIVVAAGNNAHEPVDYHVA